MRHLRPISLLLASLLALCFSDARPTRAQAGAIAWLYCYTGSGAITSSASYLPCSATNPLQVSGGGGGGGAVTIADGADVAEGATTDAAAAAGGTGTVSAKLRLVTTQLGTINATLGSPFQAGGSIGNTAFGISGTLPAFGATPTFNLGTLNGAATAANQTTMATNQTAVQTPVAPGTATATKAELIAGQYNSAVQAFTNGQQGSLQFDQRGGLLIQDGQAIPPVSVTSAATLFTVADTSGYSAISVQVTSAGTTCTITYEASEDGTTWTSVVGYSPASSAASAPSSTSTAIGTLWFPAVSKQFRARVSTYSSGTVTTQATLRKDPLPKQAIQVGFLNGSNGIAGSSADGSAAASSLAIGFEGRTTNKTAVTTGQMVRPIATSIGAAVNKPFQVPELDWSYPAAAGGISNTTTAVTIVAAAGAGIRNYLTAIQVSAGALGAASEIAVRDGAGGTVIWRGFISTAGGNQSVNLSSPIKSTANTLLEVVTLTATITGAVYINAQGYQAP